MNSPTPQHWQDIVKKLANVAESKKVTHAQIASATGLKRPNVSRLFRLEACPRIDTLINIANCLGYNLDLIQITV